MSLHGKLSLAFVSIAITGMLLAAVLGMWNTHELRDLRSFQMERLPAITQELVKLYENNNGVWTDDFVPPLPAYVQLLDQGHKPIHNPTQHTRGRMRRPWQRYARLEKVLLSNGQIVGYLRVVDVPPARDRPTWLLADQSPWALLGFGAVLLTAGVSGVFMSKRITRPLQELTRATHAVASGDLEHRVPERSPDEIGDLARAFNSMSAQLKESQQQQRQMTQDIIHDIAQPIVVIQGLAEAMRDQVLERSDENLDIILQESGRLEGLTRSLQGLEVVDTSRLQLNRERIAPVVLVERFVKMYHEAARQAGVSLQYQVSAGALPDVDVDVERILQALGNLAHNAFHYAPPRSIVTVTAVAESEYVQIAVTDEGPGVPSTELARIFDRFYRTDKARSQHQNGSGIGLAIVASLMQAHGGSAWAENVEPHGLRVVLALPVAHAEDGRV